MSSLRPHGSGPAVSEAAVKKPTGGDAAIVISAEAATSPKLDNIAMSERSRCGRANETALPKRIEAHDRGGPVLNAVQVLARGQRQAVCPSQDGYFSV